MTECRERLFALFDEHYTGCFAGAARDEVRADVRHALACNIIHGDTLTGMTVDDTPRPICFTEWRLVKGQLVGREVTGGLSASSENNHDLHTRGG